MTQRRTPGATYRVQLNAGFRFADARDIAPFLSELGITDLYSSPRYKARRGSSHGYDIANPNRINSELGTEEDFDEMAEKFRHYGMGIVLDIVPNHMAASYENPWWTDVLENGQASAYAKYFDIDWRPATSKAEFLQRNRVLLPILGNLYGNVLANGELTLKLEDTGMEVRYYDTRLPLDPKSYRLVLNRALLGSPELPRLEEIVRELEALPGRDETSREATARRRIAKEELKERLWKEYLSDAETKRAVDNALLFFSSSEHYLDQLLSEQAYRLAFWKIGYEEINYRRFFDINDLVGLRVEDPEVFENRHLRNLELVRSGKVTGIRIDHIDGLWDPQCYLRRLKAATSEQDPYIVAEKILGRGEDLPRDWPIQGTTGYDFLNAVNGIFIVPEGLARLEEIYSAHTGSYLPFAELCYACNKQVMKTLFTGDVHALGHHLGQIAAQHRQARDIPLSELMEVLVEVTACLPVYRTYIHEPEVAPRDRAYIERTLELARRRTAPDQIGDPAFEFIRCVLLLEPPDYLEAEKGEWLRFVMRWQQFSGPVMAKGLEDTATYRHHALISINEVGSDPLRELPPFGMSEFHEFNARRLAEWPDTMNATSTHDTKRGEDLRARLNVLSEMPEEWNTRLDRWMEWNAPKKVGAGGALVPNASEEILIYQTLLGAWPVSSAEEPALCDRVSEFLTKALREAKINSSWISPREEYEAAVLEFLRRVLERDSPFMRDFREFQAAIARIGALNSLSQLAIKIASPGVPDFYQGSEWLQLSLVDPDNRRPVDYRRRSAMLDDLRKREAADNIALVRELAANPVQDDVKLFVTHKALAFRKSNQGLFSRGEYVPLEVRGRFANHVCSFARTLGRQWAVIVAPRWRSAVDDWAETEIVPPAGVPEGWRDAITCLIPPSWKLSDLLAEFPVALLGNEPV